MLSFFLAGIDYTYVSRCRPAVYVQNGDRSIFLIVVKEKRLVHQCFIVLFLEVSEILGIMTIISISVTLADKRAHGLCVPDNSTLCS